MQKCWPENRWWRKGALFCYASQPRACLIEAFSLFFLSFYCLLVDSSVIVVIYCLKLVICSKVDKVSPSFFPLSLFSLHLVFYLDKLLRCPLRAQLRPLLLRPDRTVRNFRALTNEFCVVKKRPSTDLKALDWWNIRSGPSWSLLSSWRLPLHSLFGFGGQSSNNKQE